MRHVTLGAETDYAGWRDHARALALEGVPPEEVRWRVGSRPTPPLPSGGSKAGFSVPRALVRLAGLVVQAREADRFDLLYRLIWRAQAGALALDDQADTELARVRGLALAVRAEGHRLRSQLRYLAIEGRYVGWFEPLHRVLEGSAPLLARRFPEFAVSVLTPEASAHWDESGLRFGPAAEAAAVPDDAGLEAYWRGYGAEMLAASRPETSVPEAEPLVEDPWPPDRAPLGPVVMPASGDSGVAEAAREAADCRRCPLYGPATQTVFGEGPAGARLVFVGEQPGDQEDVIGRPFVGPAGQMLDRAMAEAGIDRRSVYVTNAVKHFKFTPRGKRRIHQTPDAEGDTGLRLLARRGAGPPAPRTDRAAGRHRRAGGAGTSGDNRARAGPADPAVGDGDCVRDRAPILPAAGARRGGEAARVSGVRGGFAEGGGDLIGARAGAP